MLSATLISSRLRGDHTGHYQLHDATLILVIADSLDGSFVSFWEVLGKVRDDVPNLLTRENDLGIDREDSVELK